MSCIWVVFDKQMVLRTKRFMLVRHVKCFRSIFCGRCFRGVGRLCSSGVRESAHPSTRSSDVMIMQVLHGPHCQGSNIIRHGTTRQGSVANFAQEVMTGAVVPVCVGIKQRGRRTVWPQ